MSVLQKLTEGLVKRDLQKQGAALMDKWERTGLLEGLETARTKDTMARLLENQAKELLREASSMAAGDVEGFAAVAFPIVRRVFGGLIANELVSIFKKNKNISILGPSLAPIEREKSLWRYQILLKCKKSYWQKFHDWINSNLSIRELHNNKKNVKVLIDVDPISIL